MEKFVATIGRRWTFMEHMELPAYRDGLLGWFDHLRQPVLATHRVRPRIAEVSASYKT